MSIVVSDVGEFLSVSVCGCSPALCIYMAVGTRAVFC